MSKMAKIGRSINVLVCNYDFYIHIGWYKHLFSVLVIICIIFVLLLCPIYIFSYLFPTLEI